ncbi:ABC transporter ATP-binding protein [Mangrovicoccus algicola]|uniref:ABC transporter ATP-binding protein n=1 Tax=Mangrovicoccus algicola TaxID=2771008 RepID=A0A8J6Z9U7_9RHOB|nr:ABC transporter ATP-binding protein [Mangrovicoccus algicola]MBE3639005.1 ABC transporter ATP-binding protein [Mangrovicoccus algicola]
MLARFRASPPPPEEPVAPDPGPPRPAGPGSVRFVSVSKSYRTGFRQRKYVIRDCSVLFPAGRKVALLGHNGSGKSTMMRLISGAQDYDSGEIICNGAMSWPIGFAGAFHPEMTGAQNARFVARVHGIDTDAMVDFVQDFSELGDYLDMPFRTYSSGMRARLAFGVSMGVPFDCYLVDEVTSVGDKRFREKCAETFHTRLSRASAIMATHSLTQVKTMCDMAAVLHAGTLTLYDSVEEGLEVHKANQMEASR